MTVIERAIKKWDSLVDDYNKWPELDIDEQIYLVSKEPLKAGDLVVSLSSGACVELRSDMGSAWLVSSIEGGGDTCEHPLPKDDLRWCLPGYEVSALCIN